MNMKVILVGGFIEIIELCEEKTYSIIGIIDNCGLDKMYSHKVICNDKEAIKIKDYLNQYSLIITPDRPDARYKLMTYYENLGCKFAHLISSSATISKSALIGDGAVIQTGVNISSEVKIGRLVKINSCANVMHNSVIGDFCTIAPNAVILGYVEIGNSCYIGANSTVLPNLKIANSVTIGAGAVVTKDILESGSIYAGVPARRVGSAK
jgi:sugar O-acyltransferase (sialic acid O-acetyltransferase NeuD family)